MVSCGPKLPEDSVLARERGPTGSFWLLVDCWLSIDFTLWKEFALEVRETREKEDVSEVIERLHIWSSRLTPPSSA